MPIKFCLATKRDFKALLGYFRKNDTNFTEAFTKKRIAYYTDNHFIVLAKDGKKIVGHLFFLVKETPKLGVGEFETVNVHEDYRGKGLGSELIQKSILLAKAHFKKKKIKLRCIYLMTRSNNFIAQKTYKKLGFKSQNKIGKIFKDNEPEEIVMTLFL